MSLVATILIMVLAQSGPVRLSLDAAIQAALENNASVELSGESEVQSRLKAREEKAALLPNFALTGQFSDQTISLGAIGIQFAGVAIPNRVGPFGIGDMRVRFSEPVLDMSLIRRYQAAKRSTSATSMDTAAVRQKVAAMVARLYYNVQRAAALTESSSAQIRLDDKLLQLANDRKSAGAGIGLDVTRAASRLASDRQLLLQYENDHQIAEYQLLRAMGNRLETKLELTDTLSESLFTPGELDSAISTALSTRPEVHASIERMEASRVNHEAVNSERLPSIRSFADYGAVSTNGSTVSTDTVGVQLRIPLWDGNGTSSRRAIAASQLRQEEIRNRDLRDEIELEVRTAFSNLASTREQVHAATEALRLAETELEQARVRFEAQVTTQIDVITAQTNLSNARTNRVNALFALKSAEIEYKRATGVMF
jgi:outer membrane protein